MVVTFCLLAFSAIPSCLSMNGPLEALPPLPDGPTGSLVQKGTVTVVDGGEARVFYKKPFESPPHLVILGFSQSWFKQKPFRLTDFEIVHQEAGSFKIQSNHGEAGSWAVLEWRADGTPAAEATLAGKNTPEQVVARIERLKGEVTRDAKLPDHPVIAVDLHRTHATDSDLELLGILTKVRTLNLYGTPISDAGLAHLSGMTSLETLHLSSTGITGAGLQYLGQLSGLRDLNLYRTQVGDEGLRYLANLPNLQKLTLSETRVSDGGLQHLKGLHKLHFLLVSRTSVTDAGIKELQRALPDLQVVR
jgi:hypothetical protein